MGYLCQKHDRVDSAPERLVERWMAIPSLTMRTKDPHSPEASCLFANDRSLKVCYDRSLANKQLASGRGQPFVDLTVLS